MNNETIEKIFSYYFSENKISNILSFSSGHYNDVYKITTNDNSYILRIAPDDNTPKLFYEKDMMQAEPYLHKLIAEKTDVPLPKVLYYDFSKEFIKRDFLIMEFMIGEHSNFSLFELGRLVKKLHSVKADFFGYPNRNLPKKSSWKETFLFYVELIFNDCLQVGAITKEEYNWFLDKYYKYKNSIKEVLPVFLHLDLWSANILVKNGKINAILDFDRGMFGDPELEFAVLDTYGYATKEFFSGYGTPRPNDKDSMIRQRLYIVYELIKYTFIRLARRGLREVAKSFVRNCMSILNEI